MTSVIADTNNGSSNFLVALLLKTTPPGPARMDMHKKSNPPYKRSSMGNPPAHTLPQATPQVPPPQATPQTTHLYVTL